MRSTAAVGPTGTSQSSTGSNDAIAHCWEDGWPRAERSTKPFAASMGRGRLPKLDSRGPHFFKVASTFGPQGYGNSHARICLHPRHHPDTMDHLSTPATCGQVDRRHFSGCRVSTTGSFDGRGRYNRRHWGTSCETAPRHADGLTNTGRDMAAPGMGLTPNFRLTSDLPNEGD